MGASDGTGADGVLLTTTQAEGSDAFSEFHLYVCLAFLIKWSDQLRQMDFQVSHPLTGLHIGCLADLGLPRVAVDHHVPPVAPDPGLDRRQYRAAPQRGVHVE